MEQLKTEALVDSLRDRVDPGARSRKSGGMTLSTMLSASSVSLDPMPIEEANKLVKRFLAGFPNLGAHNPEGYILALVSVMVEFPIWAGNRVITKVDEVNPEFPPSERQLRMWLNEIVAPWRFAAEWNERARKQIAESPAPVEGRAAPEAQGEVFTNYDEAFKKYGRPIGVNESGRQLPHRG